MSKRRPIYLFFSETPKKPAGNTKRANKIALDYDLEPAVEVKQRNTHSLENTCLACDRINIGNRAAAHVCNSYAQDMGWLTQENRLTHT